MLDRRLEQSRLEMNMTKKEVEYFADTKGSLDGELAAGRKMSGEIAFAVEETDDAWEFVFEPNVFGFGQAIFEITADEVK